MNTRASEHTDLDRNIATAITERFNIDVRVRFDFRRFRLVCERLDGFALSPGMQAMFSDLTAREYRNRSSTRTASA